MRNKIDLYSRISVAIVLAFMTSQLLVQEVFLAYSPALRPDIGDRVVETTLAFINIDNYRNFFSKDNNKPASLIASTENEALEQLNTVAYKPTVISGVYAKETENASLYHVNIDEIDWIEIFYERKDGTIEKVRIPRGTEPPPPGLF